MCAQGMSVIEGLCAEGTMMARRSNRAKYRDGVRRLKKTSKNVLAIRYSAQSRLPFNRSAKLHPVSSERSAKS